MNDTILIQNPPEISPLPAGIVGPDIIFVPTFVDLNHSPNDKAIIGGMLANLYDLSSISILFN